MSCLGCGDTFGAHFKQEQYNPFLAPHVLFQPLCSQEGFFFLQFIYICSVLMQCKINSYCYVQGGRNRNKYIVHLISRYSIVMHACETHNRYLSNVRPPQRSFFFSLPFKITQACFLSLPVRLLTSYRRPYLEVARASGCWRLSRARRRSFHRRGPLRRHPTPPRASSAPASAR